jgi:hypothetical protein
METENASTANSNEVQDQMAKGLVLEAPEWIVPPCNLEAENEPKTAKAEEDSAVALLAEARAALIGSHGSHRIYGFAVHTSDDSKIWSDRRPQPPRRPLPDA